jgi:hypothetical protein
MIKQLYIPVMLALGGCTTLTPDRVNVEVAHTSHLTAGWPLERQKGAEDGISTLGLTVEYTRGKWYLAGGIGVNLEGHNGGGFYGPAEVSTIRGGYSVWSRK